MEHGRKRGGAPGQDEEYCRAYSRLIKEWEERGMSEGLAYELCKMNTEEYAAYAYLKRNLGPANLDRQMKLTEDGLRSNPKSYVTWFHRLYLVTHTSSLAVSISLMAESSASSSPSAHSEDEEVSEINKDYLSIDEDLTRKLLSADPRNLHCWAYRRALFGDSKEFAVSMIKASVSNYSAYHSLLKASASAGETGLSDEDMEHIVFAAPDISSPWEFLSSRFELSLFGKAPAYLKMYERDVHVVLRRPARGCRVTAVYPSFEVEKSAPYKRIVSVSRSISPDAAKEYGLKTEGKGRMSAEGNPKGGRKEGLTAIEVRWADGAEAQCARFASLSPFATPPPEFLVRFLEQERTRDALLLLLKYRTQEREPIIQELAQMDPQHAQLYQAMSAPYDVVKIE